MEKDELSALKLDEQYKDKLALIRPCILSISTVNEAHLCRLWLDKLNHCRPHERVCRNVYVAELCRQVQTGRLSGPFLLPPPEGALQSLDATNKAMDGHGWQHDDSSSWSDVTESSACRPHWRMGEAGESGACLANQQDIVQQYKQALGLLLCTRPQGEKMPNESAHLQELHNKQISSFKSLVKDLQDENTKLAKEVSDCRAALALAAAHPNINTLAEEVAALRHKLSDLQQMKLALETSHNEVIGEYRREMTESVGHIWRRLQDANRRNSAVEHSLDVLSQQLEHMDQKQVCRDQQICEEWKQKLEDQACIHQQKLAELQHGHVQDMSEARAEVDELKMELAAKEREVMRLQEEAKEQHSAMQADVRATKKEIQRCADKSEQRLKAKILTLQKMFNKCDRMRAKTMKECDKKIFQLEREHNIEVKSLQFQLKAQRAEIAASVTQDKQRELEALVSSLEERYKQLLMECDRKAAHAHDSDQQRIAQLESQLEVALKRTS